MSDFNRHRRASSGFTMIEVLIALIIMAIGLLGVAGLQTVSMQQTAAADSRSVAIMHTQTMAEYIRSIRGMPAAGEVEDWESQLQNDLGPGSTGTVEANGGSAAVISVQWVERMNRLDPGAGSAEGGESGEKEEVIGSFSLNVRYRE